MERRLWREARRGLASSRILPIKGTGANFTPACKEFGDKANLRTLLSLRKLLTLHGNDDVIPTQDKFPETM